MRPEQRDVVRYWHLLELFSPQKVDPADPRDRTRPVIDWRDGRPLPWDALPPPRSRGRQRMVWQHTVYLNVYPVAGIYEHLHSVFPRDEDAYEERPGGLSACAALVVDQEGRYIADSAVLSSALWGVGRTINPGVGRRDWYEGFDGADAHLREAVEEYLADVQGGPDEPEPRLGPADLRRLLALAVRVAGIDGVPSLHTRRVHVASTGVREDRAQDLPGFDFLNSFHLKDLRAVADAGKCGPALAAYLTPDDRIRTTDRVDVRRSPEQVIAATSIRHLPPGRWLTDPGHPLSTSQQLAVNLALAMHGGGVSLLGVNGPPGTGKTTMLRDILAGNVTERAERLARLDHPDRAFVAGALHEWKSGDYTRRVRQLLPDLTGFEMVLASSNNAAVSNVSDELPLSANVHERWVGVDYFAELATEIGRAGAPHGEGEELRSRWGIVAARLGNATNRHRFASAFWFGRTASEEGRSDTAVGGSGAVAGMQDRLKGWESNPTTRPSWSIAREAFLEAQAHLATVLDARKDAERRIVRADKLRADQHRLREEARTTEASLRAVNDDLVGSLAACAAAEEAVVAARARYERHLQLRPGWWESLTSRGRAAKEWREGLVPLVRVLDAAERERLDVTHRPDQLRGEQARLQAALDVTRAALVEMDDEAAELEAALVRDHERSGPTYPGAGWLSDDRFRELHAAWLDPEVNTARSDMFRAALDLHLAFVAHAKGARQALHAALDVVTGRAPADLDPAARLAAWQFFFMVVPLVSTTFASVPSMLRGLRPEALGWLLIDEAGQAGPQEAVGAIWRAKRVIAVGDPMQLKPIVTVPPKAQYDLALQFQVSETWIPSLTSVQQLADRVGRYGTALDLGEKTLWVSAPLRVHRRCDAPMFGICNEIAYGGLMVDGVGSRHPLGDVPESQWYDVPASRPGSHLQPREITWLRERLDDLVKAGVSAADVIVISPFRAVADELSYLSDDYPGITAGTVHTAQGREADVVFLVLGGDPRKPGARRWASSAPNLVNVAVSRARRRLYVIGDRRSWAAFPFFDIVSARLASARAVSGTAELSAERRSPGGTAASRPS